MDQKQQDKMIQEAKRRELEYKASFLPDAARDEWSKAAAWTQGKRVHDIIEADTAHGDDLLIWVYVPLLVGTPRQPDLNEGDLVVLMILYLEQHKQSVSFHSAKWNGQFYEDEKRQNLVDAARQGSIL